MAISDFTGKRNKKVVRKTHSEQYLVNLKYMGSEPVWSPGVEIDWIQQAQFYNWHNVMSDLDDLKMYVSDFLLNVNRNDLLKKYNKIPDNYIKVNASWAYNCRLMTLGIIFKRCNEHLVRFEAFINEMMDKRDDENDAPVEKVAETKKPSVQDRIRDQVSEVIYEIEKLLDEKKYSEIDVFELMTKAEFTGVHAKKVADFFKPLLDELMAYALQKDEQIIEAYSSWDKKTLANYGRTVEKIVKDAMNFNSAKNATKEKKGVSEVKMKAINKQLANLKYQKEDKDFKLISVNPSSIIGSKALLTFDTKYKIFRILYAADLKGLIIEGTSIKNYDEKKSFAKSGSRKTEEILAEIPNLNISQLRVKLESLKTDSYLSGRIGESTILVRVFK